MLGALPDLPDEIDLASAAGIGGLELKPGNLFNEDVRDREVTGLSRPLAIADVFRALSGDYRVSLIL